MSKERRQNGSDHGNGSSYLDDLYRAYGIYHYADKHCDLFAPSDVFRQNDDSAAESVRPDGSSVRPATACEIRQILGKQNRNSREGKA